MKIFWVLTSSVVLVCCLGGAYGQGSSSEPKEVAGFLDQVRAVVQWGRLRQTDSSGTGLPDDEQLPVSISDLQSAVESYSQNPEAQESLLAMELVYLSSHILKGDRQAYATKHTAAIEDLVVKHHLGDSAVFGFALDVSRETRESSLLERLFRESREPQFKASMAEFLVSQSASYLRDASLSQAERGQLKSLGNTYGELFVEKYGQYAPDFDGIPLKMWRVKGMLYDINHLGLGEKLPGLTMKDLEGNDDNTTHYAGKVMLIDFWTTWCVPCKASLPHIAQMVKELKGKPFQMISVACDKEVEPVIEFREYEQPMPWVHWHSPALTEEGEQYGIIAYPTYIVVDSEGVIRMKTGSFDEVESLVRELVTEAVHN